jgi:hypothetical protein
MVKNSINRTKRKTVTFTFTKKYFPHIGYYPLRQFLLLHTIFVYISELKFLNYIISFQPAHQMSGK